MLLIPRHILSTSSSAAMTEAVSLGKGAWDCDANCEIPPEKEVHEALLFLGSHDADETHDAGQRCLSIAYHRPVCAAQAQVFEEIATMDYPFEGIPTVPPRKDMDHMV